MKILLRPHSGLGNQLFQYAAGLFYAKKYGAELEIVRRRDERTDSFGHPRPFLLSSFRVTAPISELTRWDSLMFSSSPAKMPLAASARFVSRTVRFHQDADRLWYFLPELPVRRSTRYVYLEGYFQVYQCAQDVEERLRAEFRFRTPACGKNLDVLEQIRAVENPVSLHVRRGDYAVWGTGSRVLSPHYYARAMETVHERTGKPTFFVFSDDMAFARENMPSGEQMVFVDHNDEANPHEDLRLMSGCRHHIIANSTLSWWGAWLNPAPEKLVCVPKSWHNDDLEISHPDIIPPGWLRIDPDKSSSAI